MGDAIWPEENFALVFWCDEEEALGIESAVAYVKEHFPDEGIKLFGLPDHESTLRAVPVQAGPAMEAAAKDSGVKEPPINRHTAAERFIPGTHGTAAGPETRQTEKHDSFTEKAAQDMFEERPEGTVQFNRFDQIKAEAERSEPAAKPADVDNWLSHQGSVQDYAPPVDFDRPLQESAPAASPSDGGVRQDQPEGGPQTILSPPPSPSPESEQTPIPPDDNISGMEGENF
jgi:hypothetical protein